MAAELQDWRKNILQQLEFRKTLQVRPYQELIDSRKYYIIFLNRMMEMIVYTNTVK